MVNDESSHANPRYPWAGLAMFAAVGAVLGWVEAAVSPIGLVAGAAAGAFLFAFLQYWSDHHVR